MDCAAKSLSCGLCVLCEWLVPRPGSGVHPLCSSSAPQTVSPASPGRQQGRAGGGAGSSLQLPLCSVQGQGQPWSQTLERERGGRGGRPVGFTAPGWDFGMLKALAVGTGVTSGGWVEDATGETPITHLDQQLESQRHHGIGSIWAGVPVLVVGLSCESGRDMLPPFARPPPPLLDQKGEKEKLGKVCTEWGVSHPHSGAPVQAAPCVGCGGRRLSPKPSTS